MVDDLATIVNDEIDASHFTLDNGVLMFNGKFVGANNADIDAGNSRFQLFDSPPDVAATWAAVLGGGINFSNDLFTYDNGDAGVCSDSNGDVYFLFTSKDGLTCTDLQLTALDGGPPSNSTPTTTAEPEPTATATDEPTPTDTQEPTPTDTDTPQPTDTDGPIPTTSDDSTPTPTDEPTTTAEPVASTTPITTATPTLTSTPTSTLLTTTTPTTTLPVSTPATTTSQKPTTTSLDPSADGEFDAAAETAAAAKHRKRSFRANVVRRGGLFRSPLKKRE